LDLLLTDMVLPEIDGAAVAEKAVASRPNLRVLFHVRLYRAPGPAPPGFDRGAPLLHKPFTREALTAKVREVLEPQ
jgi:two-component system, cell cycle sensor histidine kinase and response regulator CckA